MNRYYGRHRKTRKSRIPAFGFMLIILILGLVFSRIGHPTVAFLEDMAGVDDQTKPDYTATGEFGLFSENEEGILPKTTTIPISSPERTPRTEIQTARSSDALRTITQQLRPTPGPDTISPQTANSTQINGEEWYLTLVNSTNPLKEGYKPELQAVGNGHYFDKRAADSLQNMLNAAKGAGLSPIICSSYRTLETQTALYNDKVKRLQAQGLSYNNAREQAKMSVAYPGTSEHHLGLAADIVALSYQSLNEAQAKTPENIWLKENCHKYGFIVRYPSDKSEITGIIYEPWHFRYVGVEAATEIMEKGICLEEYLETP